MTYQVRLSYATFGIIVNKGIVVKAAPIGRWMVGKPIEDVRKWVAGKRGSMLTASTPAERGEEGR